MPNGGWSWSVELIRSGRRRACGQCGREEGREEEGTFEGLGAVLLTRPSFFYFSGQGGERA